MIESTSPSPVDPAFKAQLMDAIAMGHQDGKSFLTFRLVTALSDYCAVVVHLLSTT